MPSEEHLEKPPFAVEPGRMSHPHDDNAHGGTVTDLTGQGKEAHTVEIDGMAAHYRSILESVGEDPTREGLLKTPDRAAAAMRFFTQGYSQSIEELLNDAIFEEQNNQMVVLRDIEFFSNCEHHLVPFFGKCHIAYIPDGKIVGVSKMARIVDMFARRLQVQERMTNQIADALEEALQPKGVGVIAEGIHLCMVARGVEKQHSKMTTSAMRGAFLDLPTRMELLSIIRNGGNVF
jgi:GTP cyclohydrolase I